MSVTLETEKQELQIKFAELEARYERAVQHGTEMESSYWSAKGRADNAEDLLKEAYEAIRTAWWMLKNPKMGGQERGNACEVLDKERRKLHKALY